MLTVSLSAIALIASIQIANAGDCNYGLWKPYFDDSIAGGTVTEGGLAYAEGVCQTKLTGASTLPVVDLAFKVECDYSGSEPAANVLVYEVDDADCSGTPQETIALPEGDFMCCEACELYCDVSQLMVELYPNPDCNDGIVGNSETFTYGIYAAPSQQCYEAVVPFLLTPNQTLEFLTSRRFEISDSALTEEFWFDSDCNGTAFFDVSYELNECANINGSTGLVSVYTSLEVLVEDDTPDMVMASDLTGAEYGDCNYGLYKPGFDGFDGTGTSGRGLAYANGVCNSVVSGSSTLEIASSFMVRCDYSILGAPAKVWKYNGVADCSGVVSEVILLEEGQYECLSELSCGLDQLVVESWPNEDCGATTVGNSNTYTYGIYTAESQGCYNVEDCPVGFCSLPLPTSRQFSFGETSISQMRYADPNCAGDVETITLTEDQCNPVPLLDGSFRVTLTPFVLDDGTMETTMEGEGDDVGYHSVNMLVVFGLFFVNYFL